MARAGRTARGFLGAVELAHAAAVALLCTGLTCVCASPPLAAAPAAGTEGAAVVVAGGLANLSPSEFLASLRRAAVNAPAVGLLDRARLTSWARAPAGAGHYPRCSLEELLCWPCTF
jgi:ataxia telangiectasia mutated family protein